MLLSSLQFGLPGAIGQIVYLMAGFSVKWSRETFVVL